MAGIVFSQISGQNDPVFGRYLAPIRALIQEEIDKGEAENNLLTSIFNVETSNRYAEAIGTQTSLSSFAPKIEGGIAVNDEISTAFTKIIEHIEFAKEFAVTRKMIDDSMVGVSSDVKRIR